MAYVSAQFVKIAPLGPSGRSLWFYDAGADSAATIAGSGYVSDAAEGTSVAKGQSKGVNKGDPVIVMQSSSENGTGIALYTFSAIAATGAGTLIKTSTA